MTVTATMVGMVDRGFTLSESDSTYVQLKAWAQAQLDSEIPSGVPSAIYDRLHALLIAHMWESADPVAGYKSYSTGGFSASQDVGQSIWLLEYKQIIETYALVSGDSGSESDYLRADADMPEFKLDQAEIPSYYTETT